MGDQDWLERGHGSGAGLQPMTKGLSRRVGDRVSIRSVLRGADAPRGGTRRRTKALVGWLLYCCTAVGGSAAAWTVRETLFPSLGAPTTRSVWEHPSLSTPATTEQGTTSTEARQTAVTKAPVVTSVATAQSPIDEQTVPSASSAGTPANSVDNQASSGTTGPATAATNASSGPGPGTTVGEDPTDTSVPHSGPTGNTTDPGPSTSDSDGDSSGKGSGGNSGPGGGDGDGGDPTTP